MVLLGSVRDASGLGLAGLEASTTSATPASAPSPSTTTKKELLLSFGDFYWEMEEYIQKNKLDINMQSGLQKTFEHYNAKFERLPDY